MVKLTPDQKEDAALVRDKISNIDKSEIDSMQRVKKSRLRLTRDQKKLARIIKRNISCMSNTEKLKAMTPNGVQKLMNDANEELKALEEDDG